MRQWSPRESHRRCLFLIPTPPQVCHARTYLPGRRFMAPFIRHVSSVSNGSSPFRFRSTAPTGRGLINSFPSMAHPQSKPRSVACLGQHTPGWKVGRTPQRVGSTPKLRSPRAPNDVRAKRPRNDGTTMGTREMSHPMACRDRRERVLP